MSRVIALAVTNSGHIVSGDVNDVTRESTMLQLRVLLLGFSLNLPRLPLFTETRTADEMGLRVVVGCLANVRGDLHPSLSFLEARFWRTMELRRRGLKRATRMFYN